MKYLKLSILIVSICSTFVLSGCGNDTYKMNCIREEFPNAEVIRIPNSDHEFIIRKNNGEIWYACHIGFSNKKEYVYNKIQLFSANK